MIRLRISKRALRAGGWVLLVMLLAGGLYGLGSRVTPRDGQGRPMVLSPSLRATERYRARLRRWMGRLAGVDDGLTGLLAREAGGDPAELYAQNREMQRVGEEVAGLVREIAAAEVSVALVGLHDQALAVSRAYLEAAAQTADWLSAPSEEGRREALALLRTARSMRVELEGNRWLSEAPRPRD